MSFIDTLLKPIGSVIGSKPLVPVIPKPAAPPDSRSISSAISTPISSILPKLDISSIPFSAPKPTNFLDALAQPIKKAAPIVDLAVPQQISNYSGPSDVKKITDFAKEGYDTLKQVTLKDVSENTVRASAEFTTSAFEALHNFLAHVGNSVRSITGEQRVDWSSGKPSLTSEPIKDLTHESYTKDATLAGIDPAHLSGEVVGGAVPYMVGGAALEPVFQALEVSSPFVKFFGKAFLNGGLQALIQSTEPLKDGETQLSRLENNAPGIAAFAATSVIPDKITSTLATVLSQFGIGKLKGEENAQNFVNSSLAGLFALVGHTPVAKNELVSFEQDLNKINERMIAIANQDLGRNPEPKDVMVKAMAQEYINSSPKEQKGFIQNVKDLVMKVVEKYNNIPNKKGGFAKNPFFSEERVTPEDIQRGKVEMDKAREEAIKLPETHLIETPERNTMREEIAANLYGSGAKNKGRRADIIIGLSASGKSTLANRLADQHGSLVIDTDKAAKLLPEHNNGNGDIQVHREASRIAQRNVLGKAVKNGDNFVLPTLGRYPEKLKNILDELKANGYSVHLHHVQIPVEVAQSRTVARYLKGDQMTDYRLIDEPTKLAIENTYGIIRNHEAIASHRQISGETAQQTLGQRQRGVNGQNSPESSGGRRSRAFPSQEGQINPLFPTAPGSEIVPKTQNMNRPIGEGSASKPEKPRTVFSSAVRTIVRQANRGESSAIEKLNRLIPHESPLYRKIFDAKGEIKPLNETQSQVEALGQKELEQARLQDELQGIKDDKKLTELKIERDILQQVQDEDVAGHEFVQFISKTTGRLPELTGKKTMKSLTGNGKTVANSLFGQQGDKIIQNILGAGSTYANSPTTETAQKVVDDYLSRSKRIRVLNREIRERSEFVRSAAKIKTRQIQATKQKPETSTEEPPEHIKEQLEARSKALRNQIADRLAREQADAVVAFFDENPDILDSEDTAINENMATFIDEWMQTTKDQAENAVDDETAEMIEKERGNEKDRALNKIVDKYAKEGYAVDRKVLEENKGVVPPLARGGIRAPQFPVHDLKDISAIHSSNSTNERLIEMVAKKNPELAKKLNDFLIENVRKNEVLLTEFKNQIFEQIRAKYKELGIKFRSKEDYAGRVFGEGKMSLDQLMREFPKNWAKIQEGANYARDKFDAGIDIWNTIRSQFGYKPVKKRSNYFRHGQEIRDFIGAFGFLTSDSQLPTEIAGITDDFKPGKQFTSAELKRSGDKTNLGMIESLNNWYDSVTPQMFHIDSIQRGRALEKYIRATAKVDKSVVLPNFVSNLNEYTNFLAGKQARVDRGLEHIAGRNVLKFIGAMKQRFGANAVGANLSTALSNLYVTPFNLSTVGKIPFIKGMASTLATPFQGGFNKIDGIKSDFLTRRYPEKWILPTNWQKAGEIASIPFDIVDRFSARNAVASRYYEGVQSGLSKEEAMKRADNYAVRLVADRSRGNLPNLMNSKTLGLLTQFMTEQNNNMSTLFHDIPLWSKENVKKGEKATDYIKTATKDGKEKYVPRPKNWRKISSSMIQFIIFAHLFAWAIKKIKGNQGIIDPIQLGLDITGMNDDEIPFYPEENARFTNLSDRAKKAIGDFANQLPYSNLFAGGGRIAFTSSLPNLAHTWDGIANLNWHTLLSEAEKPVAGFLPPFGGAQAKKTIEGLVSYFRGYTNTYSGKKAFNVSKTPANFARTALFGPYASSEGQDYLGITHSTPLTPAEKRKNTLKKYGVENPAANAAKDILDKYKISN